MKLKNYQEDLVLQAISIALENRPELLEDEVAVNDIAAFVLNRLPPRYIMSERGFTRLVSEEEEPSDERRDVATMVQLLVLVNRGIELVENRRKPSADNPQEVLTPEDQVMPVLNFPQIVGKVVDAHDDRAVANATVTLYVDEDLADPAEPGWPNPFVTSLATRGYYSFWPRHRRGDETASEHPGRITVEHPDYETAELALVIPARPDFAIQETIDHDSVHRIEPIALRRKA
jgi:competence protein ComFB